MVITQWQILEQFRCERVREILTDDNNKKKRKEKTKIC